MFTVCGFLNKGTVFLALLDSYNHLYVGQVKNMFTVQLVYFHTVHVAAYARKEPSGVFQQVPSSCANHTASQECQPYNLLCFLKTYCIHTHALT